MTPAVRVKLRKVRNITVWWMIINLLFALYNDSLLHSNFVTEISDVYDLRLSILVNVISALLAGIFGASLLIFVVYERFRRRPYIQGILAASGTFVVVFYIITPVVSVIYYTGQTGESPFDKSTRSAMIDQMLSSTTTTYMLVWALLIAVTWLFIQISEKFGPGVLLKLIKGDYQFPRQEDRVFMFIDLKSSTTIAEKLGNEKYFELLRDFYSDCTDPVLYSKGEIYQYVGDEIVITWPLKVGVKDDNCIKCYLDLRSQIMKRGHVYQEKFGLIPEFRVGIHSGKVITGEIGIIKKDIAFSGDVLNTTSRITDECKRYDRHLLASETLADSLSAEVASNRIKLGGLILKGKTTPVNLVSFDFS